MISPLQKIKEWATDDAARGLASWVILIAVLVLINQRYDFVRTSVAKTVEGLETRELYLRQIGSGFCVGDIVRFRSAERRSSYFRKVMAEAGSVLTLTESGYRIDKTDAPMETEWTGKARAEMGDAGDLTVADGHILFVNADFDATKDYNNWAFETVPRESVTDWVSHVLFSRDFSRIGDKVGTAVPDCSR